MKEPSTMRKVNRMHSRIPNRQWRDYTDEHQHLRIIVAPEAEKLIVITCIELGVEWTCHCN